MQSLSLDSNTWGKVDTALTRTDWKGDAAQEAR